MIFAQIIALFWMAILFPFGQLARIPVFNASEISLYEFVMIFFLLLSFFRHRIKPIRYCLQHFRFIFLWVIWLILSSIISLSHYSLSQNIEALLYLGRLLIYSLWLAYFLWEMKQTPKIERTMKKLVYLMMFLLMSIAITQYFLYPDLRNLMYSGWDPHAFRVFGLFFDVAIAGAVYGIFFLIFFLNTSSRTIRRIVFSFLFFIGLLFTYARGTYLALTASLFIFLLLKKKVFLFLLFLIILAIALFVLPRPSGEGVNLLRTFSIESRLEDYGQAIAIWQTSPIVGIGYNHIRAEKDSYFHGLDIGLSDSHAGASFHSSFLMILATSGIVGLALFCAGILQVVKGRVKLYPLIVFLFVLSIFDNVLLHSFVLWLLPIGIWGITRLSDI